MAMNQPRAQADQPPISDARPLPDGADAALWWTVLRWPNG
ncbi:hypothetical protein HMPREF9946_00109 [Acetobacteraceae bacterium AT-5844]|nr:hypothetical protein HMPREF9946_00109 [Acetobacteraceae bacterium AT-5844]